jgi:hypothetical protein
MSEPQAKKRRALAIFKKALVRANIEDRYSGNNLPTLGGGAHVLKLENQNGISLYIASHGIATGSILAEINPMPLVKNVAQQCVDDEAAIATLVDLIAYLKEAIDSLLPRISQDLLIRHLRAAGMLAGVPEPGRSELLNMIGMDRPRTEPQPKSRKKLRADQNQGQRGGDKKPRMKPAVSIPAHEKNRRKLVVAIKRVRSMPFEMQEHIINNKQELAKQAGISYDTLLRSAKKGGWDIDDLISKTKPK